MKVYFTFVRHGETLFNQTRRMQGQCDSPLNETGIAQAENTASALRREHFDHIFCSASERAWDTAKIVAQYHKEEPAVMKELMEFDFGTLDGQLFSDMNDIIQVHRKADDWTDVGGENVPLFEIRAKKAFEKILSACRDNDHVLIVSHGSYFSHLLKTILDYDFDEYRHRMDAMNRPLVPNCCIAEFVYEDGKYTVTREPQTADEYRAEKPKKINITAVCTGETLFEKENRKEGICDSMLSEKGISYAQQIGEKLKDIKIPYAFVSTSLRARDTADLIFKGRDIPVIYRRDLRERFYGLLEGDNKINPEDIRDWSEYGAESTDEMDQRAMKALREICDMSDDESHVLVITHRYFRERLEQAVRMMNTAGTCAVQIESLE